MLKHLGLFFIILTAASCSTVNDELREQLSNALRENPCLPEQEYNSAKELIETYPEEFPKLVDSTKKLNHYAFMAYTSKLAANLEISFDSTCCWIPEEFKLKPSPFNINVFIENSGSMDCYVNGGTEFEHTIYELISVLYDSELCDSMNLCYINASIVNPTLKASGTDIQNFIKSLEPSEFIKHGGNRGSSDLQDVVSRVINKVDEHNISVLITDCVYSPGKNEPDASAFLKNQQTGLKRTFSEKLDEQPVCFLMFQLQSKFSGKYFDRFNTPHVLNGDLRPYYIMVTATPDQLAALYRENQFAQVNWKVENQLVFQPMLSGPEADVRLTSADKIGSFTNDNAVTPRIIRDAAVSEDTKNEGQFSFLVGVNFKNLFVSQAYILDTANYIINNPSYALTIEPFDQNKSSPQLQGYKYGMQLSTKNLTEEDLTVRLKSRVPQWVLDHNSIEDTNIDQDDTEKTKTFGLEYFVGGIHDAYCMHNNSAYSAADPYYVLGQFTISIKTDK